MRCDRCPVVIHGVHPRRNAIFCKSQPILQSCWFRSSSAVGEGALPGPGGMVSRPTPPLLWASVSSGRVAGSAAGWVGGAALGGPQHLLWSSLHGPARGSEFEFPSTRASTGVMMGDAEVRFTRFPGDLEQVTTARAPRTEGAWTAASRGPSDWIAQTTPRPPRVPRAACAQPRGLCPLPGSSRLRGAGFGAFWLWSRRGLSQARGHFLQKWEEQENCEKMEKAQSPGGKIGWMA